MIKNDSYNNNSRTIKIRTTKKKKQYEYLLHYRILNCGTDENLTKNWVELTTIKKLDFLIEDKESLKATEKILLSEEVLNRGVQINVEILSFSYLEKGC